MALSQRRPCRHPRDRQTIHDKRAREGKQCGPGRRRTWLPVSLTIFHWASATGSVPPLCTSTHSSTRSSCAMRRGDASTCHSSSTKNSDAAVAFPRVLRTAVRPAPRHAARVGLRDTETLPMPPCGPCAAAPAINVARVLDARVAPELGYECEVATRTRLSRKSARREAAAMVRAAMGPACGAPHAWAIGVRTWPWAKISGASSRHSLIAHTRAPPPARESTAQPYQSTMRKTTGNRNPRRHQDRCARHRGTQSPHDTQPWHRHRRARGGKATRATPPGSAGSIHGNLRTLMITRGERRLAKSRATRDSAPHRTICTRRCDRPNSLHL